MFIKLSTARLILMCKTSKKGRIYGVFLGSRRHRRGLGWLEYPIYAKSNNLREGGMTKLVSGYPSHGFVIDRKEAKSIFINVSAPTGFLAEFSKAMMSKTLRNIDSPEPEVEIVHFGSNNAGKTDETNSPNADGSQERPQGSEQSHDGDSENGGPSAALNSSLTKSPPTKHAPKTRKGKA